MRLSWVLPYVVVQTGMIMSHASSFMLGMFSSHVEFVRTPKDGSGAEAMRRARYDSSAIGAGGYGVAAVAAAAAAAGASGARAGGVTGGATTTRVRRASHGGHGFGGGGMMSPPRLHPQEVTVEVNLGSNGDPQAIEGSGGSGRATGSPPRDNSRDSSTSRECTPWMGYALTMELSLAIALVRLSCAVAAADGGAVQVHSGLNALGFSS